METADIFEKLKALILIKYKRVFPYYDKELVHFGNREIGQLLSLIEEDCKQTISEKWVYTYLKPATVTKLPRKDMLDILSLWVGYSGWDEFRVKTINTHKLKAKKTYLKAILISMFFVLSCTTILMYKTPQKSYHICFYDQYSQEPILDARLTISIHSKTVKKASSKSHCFNINSDVDSIQIKLESPYYKNKKFVIKHDTDSLSLFLQPDDYSLMLHHYMNSNIENWKRRRVKLDSIISDNAEIIEVKQNDIGVEFLTKKEFIDKITTPIKSIKNMDVIDISYNETKKIIALRFIQRKPQNH